MINIDFFGKICSSTEKTNWFQSLFYLRAYWRQHRWPCSHLKNTHRTLAPTSLRVFEEPHWTLWLLLIVWHHQFPVTLQSPAPFYFHVVELIRRSVNLDLQHSELASIRSHILVGWILFRPSASNHLIVCSSHFVYLSTVAVYCRICIKGIATTGRPTESDWASMLLDPMDSRSQGSMVRDSTFVQPNTLSLSVLATSSVDFQESPT